MIFTDAAFFVFLAAVLGAYFLLPWRGQNLMLLVASYVFYGWWDWRFTTLLAFSTFVDYRMALWIEGALDRDAPAAARRAVTVSVVTNLAILGFFKYFNFFIDSAEHGLHLLGYTGPTWTLHIILPVGISFYTFQSMSYTIDVYRRELAACHRLTDFALYVSFFPQLVAGPIERATTLLPQILRPRHVTRDDWEEGLVLFGIGFFRKVAIANPAGILADTYFASPSEFTSVQLAVGLVLYALQIYNDFAGYSDMARGSARLLGFTLMRNFRHPYFARNISDFWRRWHISLSAWLRDYLYIPLGGSRHGRWRTHVNLMTTMLLGGLWHGANWTFVVWGGLHGLYLIGHHAYTGVAPRLATVCHAFLPVAATNRPWVRGGFAFVQRVTASATVFVLVTLAWLFFRSPDFATAARYVEGLAAFRFGNEGALLPLFVLAAYTLMIDLPQALSGDELIFLRQPVMQRALVTAGAAVVLIVMSGGGSVPFIYFQF